jgi:hypothetical protein
MLHRREGPSTSIVAAYGVRTGKLEKMVFEAICTYDANGCIADDLLRDHPYLPYSSITARPCALERKNLIVRGPDTRNGESGFPQKVMRKSPYADTILALPPPPRPPKRSRKSMFEV